MHYMEEIRGIEVPISGWRMSALVLSYLIVCVVLNFLLPQRDLVSGVEVLLVGLVWLVCTRGALPASPRAVGLLLCFVALLVVNLAVGGSLYLLAKFLTYPFVLWSMIAVGKRLGPGRTKALAALYLWVFGAMFFVNLAMSVKLGLYESRRLWAFAHVNLAGSYVDGTVLPLSIILSADRPSRYIRRLVLVVEAALTRSSGAFLSALLVLVNAKKLRLKTLLWVVLTVTVVAAAAWKIGSTFDASYYLKLRDTAAVLRADKLSELWDLAQARKPLTELGAGGEGSLTWRLYAYAVYAGAIAAESPEALILGSGAGSYKSVWQGYMPHNDFILILHDFGLLGAAAVFVSLICAIWRLRSHPVWLAACSVLVLRLAFENNIYSDWLMISWITWIGLALGCRAKVGGIHGRT